jgi:hypothetical protein
MILSNVQDAVDGWRRSRKMNNGRFLTFSTTVRSVMSWHAPTTWRACQAWNPLTTKGIKVDYGLG